jgi:hypothetical protein
MRELSESACNGMFTKWDGLGVLNQVFLLIPNYHNFHNGQVIEVGAQGVLLSATTPNSDPSTTNYATGWSEWIGR